MLRYLYKLDNQESVGHCILQANNGKDNRENYLRMNKRRKRVTENNIMNLSQVLIPCILIIGIQFVSMIFLKC